MKSWKMVPVIDVYAGDLILDEYTLVHRIRSVSRSGRKIVFEREDSIKIELKATDSIEVFR